MVLVWAGKGTTTKRGARACGKGGWIRGVSWGVVMRKKTEVLGGVMTMMMMMMMMGVMRSMGKSVEGRRGRKGF